MPKLLSGRAPVVPAAELTLARYQYLTVAQAQPSLGTPTSNNSILIGFTNGQTAWVPQSDIVSNSLPTENVLFVAKNGNDGDPGTSISAPKRTIMSAIGVATSGTTIMVFSGDYTELNPIIVPENVSIMGQDNNVTVIPQNPSLDVFKLSNASSVQHIIVKNHKAPSYAFAIANNSIINEMPTVKNCSSISGPYLNDGTLFIPNVTIQAGSATRLPKILDAEVPNAMKRVNPTGAGGGILVDGNTISNDSMIKAVAVENFTAINQGGVGIQVTNNVTVHVDSSTTKLCSSGFSTLNGGVLNLNSCTTEYGLDGLSSDGFFATPYNITIGLVASSLFSQISSLSLTNAGGEGYLADPAVIIGTQWQNGQTVQAGDQVFYSNRVYLVTTDGTFANPPPTHTDETANGTALLLYCGIIATASAHVIDGKVASITLITNGSGYTKIPDISFVGACTTAATASASLSGISEIPVTNLVNTPLNSTLISVQGNSAKYIITDATPLVSSLSYVKVSPNLNYILSGKEVNFYYDSIITANGHSFKYAGSGITYNALPSNGGEPNPTLEVKETNYGRVYYSSVNERGIYKIGDVFSIDLITNAYTVNAVDFNLTNLGAIGPLIRDGVPSGVQLKEISNNSNLLASTGIKDPFTAPTQAAVSTYLVNNYLPLVGGGTVTGVVSFNDLLLNDNTISSITTNRDIKISPNGSGHIDADFSKIVNVTDPTSSSDAATKAYVDSKLGGTQTYDNTYIGDFYINGDTISNHVVGGDINLTTTGGGQVIVTSTDDSTSVTTGAFVVNGGVGIAKNVHVGIAVHSPSFIGNLTGDADNAHIVLDAEQTNITKVGTLSELHVDNVYINDNSIINSVLDNDLYLGVTGTNGGVLPAVNLTNLGSTTFTWGDGHFTNIYGTIRTPSQKYINELSSVVGMTDNTFATIPALTLGYTSSNNLVIAVPSEAGSTLHAATFTTKSTDLTQGDIEFYPREQLSLSVKHGKVVAHQDLDVNNMLTVVDPIIKLGPIDKTTAINHNTGASYVSNYDITAHLVSIEITAISGVNTTVVTLDELVDIVNINTNDYLYLKNPSMLGLESAWKVSLVNTGSYTFNINIGMNIPDGVYTITVDQALISKQGFYGYDQTLDAFTVITNAEIINDVVTGTPGTVNAKITSPYVTITGGSINGVDIENTTIGLTNPDAAAFDIVTSNNYHASIVIPVLNGQPTVVDSFDTMFADIAKYVIKIKVRNGSGTVIGISGQDLLVVQDGTDVYITEYGIEYTNGLLGTFGAEITVSGLVKLIFTPNTTDATEINLFRFYA